MSADASQPARILIIDDFPGNVEILTLALQSSYDCRSALSGSEALCLLRQETERPDLILLDVMMPGLDGYEVCRLIKQEPGCQGIPVIFVSALAEVQSKVQALAMGGVDYITKPFNFREVRTRVAVQLRRYSLQRQLEEERQRLEDTAQARVRDVVAVTADLVHKASLLLEQPCPKASNPSCRIQQTGWILLRCLIAAENGQWCETDCANSFDERPEALSEQIIALAETIDTAYAAQLNAVKPVVSAARWPEQHLMARRAVQNQLQPFCGHWVTRAYMAALPEIARYYETVAAEWQRNEQGMNET
jgi:CheY-like chemotaxis protein